MMHGAKAKGEGRERHWGAMEQTGRDISTGSAQSDIMIAKREWARALGAWRQESGVGAIRVSCDTLASYRRGFSFPFSHGHQVISPVNT